ncbi:MAG: hypothetical protein DME23_01215 [Verrucomicrobia bacterium]|nr:MAG: hypothetical protein DME23_01215 [Verrucomicrobiota bacterium]
MSPRDFLVRVYDEHAQALFAFLLNFTRDEADTKDLLQELFVKLAKQPGLLEAARDERAYLIRLAHNLAIDLMRRRAARGKTYEQLAAEGASIFAPAVEPAISSLSGRMVRRVARADSTAGKEFLDKLPARPRLSETDVAARFSRPCLR